MECTQQQTRSDQNVKFSITFPLCSNAHFLLRCYRYSISVMTFTLWWLRGFVLREGISASGEIQEGFNRIRQMALSKFRFMSRVQAYNIPTRMSFWNYVEYLRLEFCLCACQELTFYTCLHFICITLFHDSFVLVCGRMIDIQ